MEAGCNHPRSFSKLSTLNPDFGGKVNRWGISEERERKREEKEDTAIEETISDDWLGLGLSREID